MYADSDIFPDCISDSEAYLHYGGDSSGDVDLERLSASLSSVGYEALEDHSHGHSVFEGGYGSVDMGAMMAMLVLAIIPIIVFYMACQKHIIEGVVAGAVKG